MVLFLIDLLRRGRYNRTVDKNRTDRLTPVSLAFIGDAVHTLFVRERLAEKSDCVVGTLHTAASRLVNAKTQAAVYDRLDADGFFTEEEADVARRAKNAHLHSRAKTASPTDYHKATALEAVIGYVHIAGGSDREHRLLEMCYELGCAAAGQVGR